MNQMQSDMQEQIQAQVQAATAKVLEEMVGYFGAIQIPGAVIPPIPPSLLQQLEAAQAAQAAAQAAQAQAASQAPGGGPVVYFGTPVSTFKVIDFFSFCDHLTVTNGFPTSLCSHSQRVRTRLHQRGLLHRGLLHREGCTVPLLHSTCTLALLRSTRGPLGALRSSLGQGTRLALLHRPGSTVALFRRPGGRLSLVRRWVALLSRSRVTLCGTSGLIHTLLTRGSRRYLARPFTCLCVGLS